MRNDMIRFSCKQRQVLTWWRQNRWQAIICDGAVRSGKTFCMGLSFFLWAQSCFDGRQFALCGKTVGALRRNLLTELVPCLRRIGMIVRENRSANSLTVEFGGQRNQFLLFGGKDESSAALIQGKRCEEVFPYIPFAACLRARQTLPAKVIKVNSVNLSVEVVPVIRQNACIGAFALLQRFNDVEVRQNELRGQLLHKGYYAKYSFDDVIGQSAAIRRTKETLTRMANSESPILLIGETGTGKELLAALCVGQEVARRLSRVLLSIMTKSIMKYGKTPDFFGNSNEHIIGAAVGCGMLMKLNEKQMRNAIGIAAYYCSLGVCRDWESTSPKSMIKYVPVSWMAQGAVQAAEMAELGYTGNEYTLDSEYGFPHIYCREPDVWDPEKVVEELGSRWFFTEYHYKPYPVCRYLHSVLDAFAILQEKYHFSPEQIEAIDCHTAAFVANPDQYSVANQVDVQFSGPIAMALEAFGYKPGPAWQDKIALNDPRLLAFAKKVTMHVAPEYAELRRKDPLSWYGRVEVTVGGQVYTESVDYSRGTNKDGYRLTDEEIQDRFRLGANCILPDYKAEKVIAETAQLENAANLTALFENLCL